LHLNTFNQFQIRFKPVLQLKTAMQRRFVTCFRNIATHIIALPRTLHSSNQTVLFCRTEFIVDHKTQTNVHFESLTLFLMM